MLTVAYLANRFPSPVEPYVSEEIEALRQRGVRVIAGTVRQPVALESQAGACFPDIVLQPIPLSILLRAISLCLRRWGRISDLVLRVIWRGREGPLQRIKSLFHTCLGACYAVMLRQYAVDHIHVHHGYFGSWIAMVAARLLNIGFSMTLHGSDLLLNAGYLDAKLENCNFCLTVSDYNRRYILKHYPGIHEQKVVVSRLGVEVSGNASLPLTREEKRKSAFALLAVGRLHAVKDHAFLVRACAQLQASGAEFECSIAGEGPERRNLEAMIRRHRLEGRVTLLGHVAREQMDSLYDRADVVVLTSRSEGIPLVLMEAMARGKIVVAPTITGIPELVIAGKNGLLYEPGSLDDFVDRLLFVRSLMQAAAYPQLHPYFRSAARQMDWMRHAAQVQVRQNFNRKKNLAAFGDLFLSRVARQTESLPHENSVLQQIQLPV